MESHGGVGLGLPFQVWGPLRELRGRPVYLEIISNVVSSWRTGSAAIEAEANTMQCQPSLHACSQIHHPGDVGFPSEMGC